VTIYTDTAIQKHGLTRPEDISIKRNLNTDSTLLADNQILLGTSHEESQYLEYNSNYTVTEISMQINRENSQVKGSTGMKSITRKICNYDGILEEISSFNITL
jgi:hypothetical protein